jgi:predicted ATPase
MSLYLKSFNLKETYRDIAPFSVTFRNGLNILVGENGSGKSTLLQLLSTPEEDKELKAIEFNPVGFEFRFFDTEKSNPRIKGSLAQSKSIGFDISSRFMSHGEVMLPIITAAESFKGLLLLIDEPEAGISLSNQKKVLEALRWAVKGNCQVIASTHSYVLIKSVEEIFSMDSKTWVSSKEYLDKIIL